MQFVEVTALPMNSSGDSIVHNVGRENFRLNIDLVGAIQKNKVLPKGGDKVNVGGKWFTNILIVEGKDYFK